MNDGLGSSLRTVTFGNLDSGVWGAVWGAEQPVVAVGRLDDAEVPWVDGSLAGSGEREEWRIASDLGELNISPLGEAVPTSTQQGFDQLCRIRGRVTRDREESTVDCLGRRASRSPFPDFARFRSLRDVSAWFEPGEGLSLVSLRPRRAPGQADDAITATVFEPGATVAVAEPRLSTTYSSDGVPLRLSLELWLDDDDEETGRYPRRAAGEAIGARAHFRRGELELDAELLRCHSHGREGAGVYLLVRS